MKTISFNAQTNTTVITLLLLTLFSLACLSGPEKQIPGKPYHHTTEGFRNPQGSPERTFSWHSLWFFPTRPFAPLFESAIPTGHVIPENEATNQFNSLSGKNTITWIGHQTAVIRLDGQVILIDPWFTKFAAPMAPLGPYRKMDPGISLKNLPQPNLVVVSHNHYDHMDIPTLEMLPNPEKITVIVPLNVSQYIKHIPFKKVVELDWHESTEESNIKFTALPIVHFSRRGLFDTNETLWAGFAIQGEQSKKKVFFFEGDYGTIYRKIGDEYGPFDVALIASGAYEPRSMMIGAHCEPTTCVQAGIDVGARILVPLHWGTMVLGSENIYDTGKLFKKAAIKKGKENKDIWVLKIGETREF
jgi:N-acyl-phosphatidylethanolamine-hydrolysing phospholipase D